QRLRRGADAGVRPAPAARVRARGARLQGDAPPARGRRRLLRPRHTGGRARQRDAWPQGLDRGGAVHEGARVSTLADVEILAPADEDVLTPDGLDLVARLHRELNPRRFELLERRRDRQAELDAGAVPRFLTETRDVREAERRVAGGPPGPRGPPAAA